MPSRHWRRCWSRHVLEGQLESRTKDTRTAAAGLDTVVEIPAGTADSPAALLLLLCYWRALYIWKSRKIGLTDSFPIPVEAQRRDRFPAKLSKSRSLYFRVIHLTFNPLVIALRSPRRADLPACILIRRNIRLNENWHSPSAEIENLNAQKPRKVKSKHSQCRSYVILNCQVFSVGIINPFFFLNLS